ncbi:MAG: hypothetical protein QOH29_576, partial [Actinomycetota bacterium]|nr:hypothetical protein [Actinomycetota bacterium]
AHTRTTPEQLGAGRQTASGYRPILALAAHGS